MAEVGDFELIDASIEQKFEYKKILYPNKYKVGSWLIDNF